MTIQSAKPKSDPDSRRRPASAPVRRLPSITPVPELVKHFPATRYYGSKRKLLGWLYSKFKELDFNTVLDPFGGTACVSQLFRAMRKSVTYHDAFHFNVHVATTTLANHVALSKVQLVRFLASIEPTAGVISRNFKDVFYPDDENAWLDGFMDHISRCSQSPPKTALLLYLLYQACLKKRPFNLFHRANLSLRTNRDISRSFGNLRTWETPFSSHMITAYNELVGRQPLSFKTPIILTPQNAIDIKPEYDLVYLDPPYINLLSHRNRDSYWRRYHFLEGLSTYNTWEHKIDVTSAIRLMPEPIHFTVWSHETTFKDALFELIRTHKSSTVVLSYVTPAHPSETDLIQFFESQFHEVSIHSMEYAHALSRSSKRELLVVGRPK